MKKFVPVLYGLLVFPAALVAQQVQTSAVSSGVVFEANKTQWPAPVYYKADIAGGRVFFENHKLTFSLHSLDDLAKAHDDSHENGTDMRNAVIHGHAYEMEFAGAVNQNGTIEGNSKLSWNRNYFTGNDSSKWSAEVPVYDAIRYHSVYENIDLHFYGNSSNLEYDYIVYPGGNVSDIKVHYNGLDAVQIVDGKLVLRTSIGKVTEERPFAFQVIGGVRKIVRCRYVEIHENGKIFFGYEFPGGYDKNEILIIDPVLVASTYSGATQTNYGHCATYDAQGNIYTGALSFGTGYPVTVGAFQVAFGGNTDIAISKLNPSGTNLVYATYIGGANADYPHSMVTNTAGELFIYGSTYSPNFPVTTGAFDEIYNDPNNSFLTDIIVVHLGASGSTLIGSTFVGGAGVDGDNMIFLNYGDDYRGEIVLDAAGDPYVASFSQAANFPVTAGAFDTGLNGIQDGVAFKMNSALTTMLWSTFIGGSQDDAAFGLVLATNGDVYVCGVTKSPDFPTLPGAAQSTFQGGTSDGFIIALTTNGTATSASTYYGTAVLDAVYLVALDLSGNVYCFGQSDAAMPSTPGVYSNPGSPQFISKFDTGLNTILVSTVFGNGNLADNIAPTAFMVDICGHIYAAGWSYNTNGFPLSPNALQTTTDGQDFYLIVLDQDATGLIYGSFFGGTGWEHVDGGTSRFDPNGIVYEAICQVSTNMTTTPSAYSASNLTTNYDIAVFKLDFQAIGVQASASAVPGDTICLGTTMSFNNTTTNAFNFIWDFGDGSAIDTAASPSHLYASAGSYTVTLIGLDSSGCNFSDTFYMPVVVLQSPVVSLGNDSVFCGPVNVMLDATTPGCTYLWSGGSTAATVVATTPGLFWVEVSNGTCTATDSIMLSTAVQPSIGNDMIICSGENIVLDAGNPGSVYNWSTGAITQTITVNITGTYWVDVTSGGCTFRDSLDVAVTLVPQPDLGNDTAVCPSAIVTLAVADPNASYLWSNGSTDLSIDADTAGIYFVTAYVGNCIAYDTLTISYLAYINLGPDVSLCSLPNGVTLDAGNPGSQFLWNTGATTQQLTVNEPGIYYVDIVNNSNCPLHDTIELTGDAGGGMLYVPNCFTPNRDGLNDDFCAESSEVTSIEMMIFDRWGNLIFESHSLSDCWDGKYKGEVVQEDVYAVRIKYTTSCTGTQEYIRNTHVVVLPRKK
jgi:gliding motility-associated-like protein